MTYVIGINNVFFGYQAYKEASVSNVSIPSCIKTIGYQCFYNSSVETVNGMQNIEYLGNKAFYNASELTGISLGKVKKIPSFMFYNCTSLVTLDLAIVETIQEKAFQNCRSIETLYIPDSVKEIKVSLDTSSYCYGPFDGCTGIKTINVGGVETLSTGMLKTGSKLLESLTIRGTVKTINSNAFDSVYDSGSGSSYSYNRRNGYNYEGNAALIIEEGVETIGDYAFYYCKCFTSVTLPSTITSVGNSAFAYCNGLTDMLVYSQNMPFADNSFTSCSNLTMHLSTFNTAIVEYCRAHNIPCDYGIIISSVMTLPAALTTIEEEAFVGSSAQEIDLPAAVQSIESKAFAESPSLLLITIPNANVVIAVDAFENSDYVTIMAPAGGTVQQYAAANDIPFIPIQ